MHRLTFFPLGNADCCLVDLENGSKLLFDYAATRCQDDPNDKRLDLPTWLRADLEEADRSSYNVVAFTHLDDDHTCGASDFFYLRHAAKYQGDGRVKIDTLWVPAVAITEEGCAGDAKIIQKEARYRLVEGEGIRVFSRPDALRDWLNAQGLSLDSRRHLITDAGQLVPGYRKAIEGVEFFVHSPFASRLADGTLFDRNTDALVLQATFEVDSVDTKLMLASDVDYEALSAIVATTQAHDREERLEWDVFKLAHHCSYLSLGPEKGKDKTEPEKNVKWLFEEQGQQKAIEISTSDPIPTGDTDQPPHRQAANYYRDVVAKLGGRFLVTMEHPKESAPEPLVIIIDGYKASVEMRAKRAAQYATAVHAPRAGR